MLLIASWVTRAPFVVRTVACVVLKWWDGWRRVDVLDSVQQTSINSRLAGRLCVNAGALSTVKLRLGEEETCLFVCWLVTDR